MGMNWYKRAQQVGPSSYLDFGHGMEDGDSEDIILWEWSGGGIAAEEAHVDQSHDEVFGRSSWVVAGRLDPSIMESSLAVHPLKKDNDIYNAILDVINKWPSVSFYVYSDKGVNGIPVEQYLRSLTYE